MSRRNKANRESNLVAVTVRSVLKPFKADPINNFMLRYQASSSNTRNITRAMMLNTFLVNQGSNITNSRVCAAVRINRISITTSINASIEWLSAYGPTSATVITATSTTSPGFYSQRPPKNSLAGAWSLTGSNESEPLVNLSFTTNDYIDVEGSFVLLDVESAVNVNTTATGTAGQLYRTRLDGPATTALLIPSYVLTIN
jgi:hypothetical protein